MLFAFWQVSGRTWPRDPFQRVCLDKWWRTHPKLAPETNSKAVASPCSGPDPQLKIQNVSLSEGKLRIRLKIFDFEQDLDLKLGPNPAQNMGHGTHKPAQTDSDRCWADLGLFLRRSETFELQDSSAERGGDQCFCVWMTIIPD